MNLMFISNEDRADAWREYLQAELNELAFYTWPIDANTINPLNIDYVLAWKPPSGVIKIFSNIKAILSSGLNILLPSLSKAFITRISARILTSDILPDFLKRIFFS